MSQPFGMEYLETTDSADYLPEEIYGGFVTAACPTNCNCAPGTSCTSSTYNGNTSGGRQD